MKTGGRPRARPRTAVVDPGAAPAPSQFKSDAPLLREDASPVVAENAFLPELLQQLWDRWPTLRARWGAAQQADGAGADDGRRCQRCRVAHDGRRPPAPMMICFAPIAVRVEAFRAVSARTRPRRGRRRRPTADGRRSGRSPRGNGRGNWGPHFSRRRDERGRTMKSASGSALLMPTQIFPRKF